MGIAGYFFYAGERTLVGTSPRLGMHAWEAASGGAMLQQKMHQEWQITHDILYKLSIAIAQDHVLPGPPIKLNLLTMLGPISSYSALV